MTQQGGGRLVTRAKSLISFRDSRAQSSFGITAPPRLPRQLYILTNRYRVTTANMRTYDDSFSGEKIYPGKVRSTDPASAHLRLLQARNSTMAPCALGTQMQRRLGN